MSDIQKTVVITTEEFKQIPGYSTKKGARYWRSLIIGLLEELGAKGYGFTEDALVFQLDIDVADGTTRRIGFMIKPALITVKTKRGSRWENMPKPGVTWKLMYEYMRNKIAVLKTGMLDVLEDLGGSVIMLTDQGKEVPFGEIIRIAAEHERLNRVVQLEDLR